PRLMHRMAKVLILIAIALVIANSQCFLRCSVGACSPAKAPCHQSEKSGDSKCASQPALPAPHADEIVPAWLAAHDLVPLTFDSFEPATQERKPPPPLDSPPQLVQLKI